MMYIKTEPIAEIKPEKKFFPTKLITGFLCFHTLQEFQWGNEGVS